MRHARILRGGLVVLLASACGVTSSGCTHNYYYGTTPVCGPVAVAPGTAVVAPSRYGEVCEVPTQVVGGSAVAAGPTAPSTLGGPRPPRVVLSQPNGAFRGAWRRPDPEGSLATTRVEGALDDPTLTR